MNKSEALWSLFRDHDSGKPWSMAAVKRSAKALAALGFDLPSALEVSRGMGLVVDDASAEEFKKAFVKSGFAPQEA